jgi:hypothetical protein
LPCALASQAMSSRPSIVSPRRRPTARISRAQGALRHCASRPRSCCSVIVARVGVGFMRLLCGNPSSTVRRYGPPTQAGRGCAEWVGKGVIDNGTPVEIADTVAPARHLC